MELYTPSEIEQLQQDLPYLIETSQWLKTFLAKPHPDLGRPGPVCPFVPKAIKLDYIRLRVIRSQNLVQQQVINIVLPYLNTFLELEPKEQEDSLNKAILLLFPDISHEDAPRLIDSVQKQLKPLFVESGLMLGEFHKRNQTPGLHNPNFRPLRSPIPMLAIRYMVESDLAFLQSADDLNLRIRYLQAYLKRFEQRFKDETNFKNAHQALALAKLQLKKEPLVMY
ncbi:DUF6875 domain-containing protein [Nostoc sp. 106C]|uniref:DUF6875 domain-containing protein n=1 Tax=Nostoc sp. 106C TaxID=1932667 RepID=UPI000A3A3D7A|nr:hypothetical protein [Nostoc sp. 106C]OUL17618.1 hypothetical protein BV378_38315 [Nostoc sp. RF31YmG]OUL26056.1 hypothetical protein BV375_22075 [Nostoc sp. 106C]